MNSLFTKDPVLVAYKKGDNTYTPSKAFILARWGEELDEWGIMMKRACKIQREIITGKFNEIINRVKTRINTLPDMTDGQVAGLQTPSYYD